MRQRAQRLHVQFFPAFQPVKTPGHEMPPSVFFQQTAFAHGDARRLCHQIICVFNRAITFGVFEFLVLVAGDTVEFQQPVIESFSGRDLPRTNFVGLAVPGNDRLRPCAAGGSADTQNVVQGIFPARAGKSGFEILAVAQNFRRQFDQGINLNLLRLLRFWPDGRRKLQRTHAARAGVTKPFHRIETFGRPALRRQPRINQGVAEPVGQRIRQQTGQAVKCFLRQIRKDIHPVTRAAS